MLLKTQTASSPFFREHRNLLKHKIKVDSDDTIGLQW